MKITIQHDNTDILENKLIDFQQKLKCDSFVVVILDQRPALLVPLLIPKAIFPTTAPI